MLPYLCCLCASVCVCLHVVRVCVGVCFGWATRRGIIIIVRLWSSACGAHVALKGRRGAVFCVGRGAGTEARHTLLAHIVGVLGCVWVQLMVHSRTRGFQGSRDTHTRDCCWVFFFRIRSNTMVQLHGSEHLDLDARTDDASRWFMRWIVWKRQVRATFTTFKVRWNISVIWRGELQRFFYRATMKVSKSVLFFFIIMVTMSKLVKLKWSTGEVRAFVGFFCLFLVFFFRFLSI